LLGLLTLEKPGWLACLGTLCKPPALLEGAKAFMVESVQCKPIEVHVGERGLERAVKHLKRKMATEGILRELKRRRHYMKPSIKKRKKAAEAARRRRKRVRQISERPF
jgi:small subunit ribosomal protein S21